MFLKLKHLLIYAINFGLNFIFNLRLFFALKKIVYFVNTQFLAFLLCRFEHKRNQLLRGARKFRRHRIEIHPQYLLWIWEDAWKMEICVLKLWNCDNLQIVNWVIWISLIDKSKTYKFLGAIKVAQEINMFFSF